MKPKTCPMILPALALLCMAAACVAQAPEEAVAPPAGLEAEVGERGLTSLKYRGRQLLNSGEFNVMYVALRKPDGKTVAADLKNPAASFDAEKRELEGIESLLQRLHDCPAIPERLRKRLAARLAAVGREQGGQ